MNSGEILYSEGKNDECYTRAYGVEPILKYIPENAVVWCPFDTEESEFVKQISKTHKVIRSHIKDGQDFYTYEPEEEWDCIVSNPPFTNKRKIFERALSFNKPFALIGNVLWLNDSTPKLIFDDKKLQLLMFDKRMEFYGPGTEGNKSKNVTFSSIYYCYDFLPQQLVFEKLNKPKKERKNGSRKDT